MTELDLFYFLDADGHIVIGEYDSCEFGTHDIRYQFGDHKSIAADCVGGARHTHYVCPAATASSSAAAGATNTSSDDCIECTATKYRNECNAHESSKCSENRIVLIRLQRNFNFCFCYRST